VIYFKSHYGILTEVFRLFGLNICKLAPFETFQLQPLF